MVSYSQLWSVQQSAMIRTTVGYGQLQSAMVSYNLQSAMVSYSQLWSVQQSAMVSTTVSYGQLVSYGQYKSAMVSTTVSDGQL